MASGYGPFNTPFEKGVGSVPGYLLLLNLGEGANRVIQRTSEALELPGAVESANVLLGQADWRPHLVAAIAHLLDRSGRLDRSWLWRAIDGGSWVTPQLVVAAYFSDRDFPRNARDRIERECAVVEPTLPPVKKPGLLDSSLDGLLRHVTTGPANTTQRSGKMLASLLRVSATTPGLAEFETGWRTNPALAGLLKTDASRDRSDQLTAQWMESVEQLFLERGTTLTPAFSRVAGKN